MSDFIIWTLVGIMTILFGILSYAISYGYGTTFEFRRELLVLRVLAALAVIPGLLYAVGLVPAFQPFAAHALYIGGSLAGSMAVLLTPKRKDEEPKPPLERPIKSMWANFGRP
jgi:hypothetical protein